MVKPALISGCLVAVAALPLAHAQTYPIRPVRLIVPFPPGGANDVLGLLAPAKTPDAIVRKLSAEATKAVNALDVKDKLVNALGVDPVGGSPAELYVLIRADISRWGKVISELGITAEQ